MAENRPRTLGQLDGIPLSAEFSNYMCVVATGRKVDVYIDGTKADHPTLDAVLRALDNRAHLYEQVEVHPVAFSEIGEWWARFEKTAHFTVPSERKVCDIFRLGRQLAASDLMLKPFLIGAGLIVRIDGKRTPPLKTFDHSELEEMCKTLWTMSDANSKSGDWTPTVATSTTIIGRLRDYGLDGIFSAIRCSFSPSHLGPECEMRLQVHETAPNLEAIGLNDQAYRALVSALDSGSGSMFISGPMGSGKTRLLASAVLNYSDRHPGHKVLTIEDPVEQLISDLVSQWPITERNEGRRRQYLQRATDALRSDAQLVMLQEIRDAECGAIFLEMGISGSLGISTIHTPSASLIIERLRGWKLERALLKNPETIRLLGAVRLVPCLCSCKIPIRTMLSWKSGRSIALENSVARLQRHADRAFALRGESPPQIAQAFTRNPEGCPDCRGDERYRKYSVGNKGRVQLAEMIRPDSTLLKLLYDEMHEDAETYLRTQLKVPSLREDALRRVAAGTLCPLDIEETLGQFFDPKQVDLTVVPLAGMA